METTISSTAVADSALGQHDFFPINGTDHVEMYVGNAKSSAYYFQHAFGFEPVAYAGLETGVRDKVSYVLQQGKVRLVITSSLIKDHPILQHHNLHGDGVKVIALWVDDAVNAFKESTSRGAKPYMEPTIQKDEWGTVTISGIHTYGDTVHLFVERNNYKGVFLPGYKPYTAKTSTTPVGLIHIDHIVGNVGWNEMNTWVEFYAKTMGFTQLVSFDDKDISTEYSALMSKVVSNGNGRIKFPINEPAEGKKKSQIEEYIDFYNGPGAQHIAIECENILHTVAELEKRGVEFIRVPDNYYTEVYERCGKIDEDIADLHKLNILVDRDDEGYLLQIFTKPIVDRPTLFIEIIQRKGAKSFGKGNFKALFEAIERDQATRGNL